VKLVGAYSITAFSVHLNRGTIASKSGGHTAVASWVRRAPPRTSNCPLPGMRLSSVDLYGQQPVILKVTSAQRPIPYSYSLLHLPAGSVGCRLRFLYSSISRASTPVHLSALLIP